MPVFSATPAVTLELDIDRCGNNYGNGPCNARLVATELGFVEQARWAQGDATNASEGYYDVSAERLIVNDIPIGSNTAPALFRLGWQTIGTWSIGNGTDEHTARILPGGGEIQISRTALTGNILPFADDPNNSYRIRISGNSTTNGTSVPAGLDVRIVRATNAQYRFGILTNLSSVFGTNELNIGGGIMTIERLNPDTLTTGNFRIRRIDPTNAEDDVFSVGGLSITDDGVQAQLLVGGASHGATDETGINFVSAATWNAGDVNTTTNAEFDNVVSAELPNGILVVNNTTLTGILPTESDSISFWRLRRVGAPADAPGTLMSAGDFTVLPKPTGTSDSVSLIQVGDTAAMNAGFGNVDINSGGTWTLERGTRVRPTQAFTSPMTNFAVDVASPETNSTPAYVWVLEKETVLGSTAGTGNNKCYNTWATCQDPQNYVKDEPGRTFKFVTKGILDLPGFSPLIKSHDHQPPAIKRGFDMWQREVVKITMEDIQAPDTKLDDDYIAERPVAGKDRIVYKPASTQYNTKAEYIQGDPEDTATGTTKAYISLDYPGYVNEAVLIVSNTALPGGSTPNASEIAGTWRLTRDGGGLPTVTLDGGLALLETNSTHTIFRINDNGNMIYVFADGVQTGTFPFTFPTTTASWDQGNATTNATAYFAEAGDNAGNLIVSDTTKTGTIPTSGVHRLTRSGGVVPGGELFGTYNDGDSANTGQAEVETNRISFNRTPNISGPADGPDGVIQNDEWFAIGDEVSVVHTRQAPDITNAVSWNAGSGSASQTAVYQNSGLLAVNDTELTGTFPSSTSGLWRIRRLDNSAMTPFGTLTSVQGNGFKEIRVGSNAEMITAFGTQQITSGSAWVLEQQINISTTYSGDVSSIAGLGLGNSPAGTNYFGRWEVKPNTGITYATVDALGHIDISTRAQVPGALLGADNTLGAAEWFNVGDTATIVHSLENGKRMTYSGGVSAIVDPGGMSFVEQATWVNNTHGNFLYANGFNGILCWNRNFTTTGTSPTDADNPSGTIWRVRATGVTGTNATTAATGITGTASGLSLDSGGFGGYQACLNFGTSNWNAAFGSAHTNSASAWTNAVWILEKQTSGGGGANNLARVTFANQPTTAINTQGGVVDIWRGAATYSTEVLTPIGRWNITTGTASSGAAVRSSTEIRINDTDDDGIDRTALLNAYSSTGTPVKVVVGDGIAVYEGNAFQNTAGTTYEGLRFRGGDFENSGSGIPATHFDEDTDFRIFNRTTGIATETNANVVGVDFPQKPTPPPSTVTWNVGSKDVAGNAEWDDAVDPLQDFNTLIAGGNTFPYGIFADDTYMWVADDVDAKIYAYNKSTKLRVPSQDFNTLVAAGNTLPRGIFADDTYMWVADSNDDKIYAYNKATKLRVPSQDFNTLVAAGNESPTGIFADNTYMWVADFLDDKIYAYNKTTKSRVPSQDFNTLVAAGNRNTRGISADDTYMWVADSVDAKIYAYNKATKSRVPSQDFNTLAAPGNGFPTGIFADDTYMWVADTVDDKIYGYNKATKARPPGVYNITNVGTWNASSTLSAGNATYNTTNGDLRLSNTQANGASSNIETVSSGGEFRIRRADNSAVSNWGQRINTLSAPVGGRELRINTSPSILTVFGTSPITSGPQWVVERRILVSSPVNPNNAICYNGAASGAFPTDTSGMWKLSLQGNSGIYNGNSAVGNITTISGQSCFLVGSIAEVRAAFGNGVDLKTGGGIWVLTKLEGTYQLWKGPATNAIALPNVSLFGDITTATLTNGTTAVRVSTTAEMEAALSLGDTNNTSALPNFEWTLAAGVQADAPEASDNPPDYRYHLAKQETTGGTSTLEKALPGNPGVITPSSTYMRRWIKRNAYWNRRKARFSVGSVSDGVFTPTFTSNLTINKVDFDSTGKNVVLTLKDGINLKASEGAVVPKPSDLALGAEMAEGSTDITITVTGRDVGTLKPLDHLNIGREIVRLKTITTPATTNSIGIVVERAREGTEATSHDAEETVQLCYMKTAVNAADIMKELVTEYADTRGIQFAEEEFQSTKNNRFGGVWY